MRTFFMAGWAVLLATFAVSAQSGPALPETADDTADLKNQIAELRAVVSALQQRLDRLEAGKSSVTPSTNEPSATAVRASAAVPTAAPPENSNLVAGTSINVLLDLYYGYNFNAPIGRASLLRAYDVSSNAFSLNQGAVVLENAPDVSKGKRYGARLDLQWGQATATLQGSSANEPRPDVYRNIFQAYGTYIFPLAQGLTVDVGKWASSIGYEGNYGKDQLNYSRSLWFDYLPFYHNGVRANFKLSDSFSANYWMVNGTQQTEPVNGFKDELIGFTAQPTKNLSWTVNYYLGQEHADFAYLPNSTDPSLPQLQGIPFAPISNPPQGKLHIFDSYATWQLNPAWAFTLEGDYVVERRQTNSAPARVSGGALYGQYRLSPKIAFAGRAEYLMDHGGLFSGVTQAVKETTLTADYKLADRFLLRGEWRRDASNRAFFLTDKLGVLKKDQATATLGLIWWFGPKEGSW